MEENVRRFGCWCWAEWLLCLWVRGEVDPGTVVEAPCRAVVVEVNDGTLSR